MLIVLVLAFVLAQAKGAIVAASPQPAHSKEDFVVPFTPMAKAPDLPKVDHNSCPFEGCRFGKWTARSAVKVFSSWRSDRKVVAGLSKGEEVTALTGVSITIKPGKGTFTRDVPMFGAKAGDTLYTYKYCGEGAEDLWVRGRFIQCSDPNFSWKPGIGCQTDCNGRYLELAESEWWVQIRLKNGKTGWVRVTNNFDGTDSLA